MSEWRGPYPFVDDAERELFSMSWSQWRDRAKAAEAEVERLTAERDALRAGGAVAQAAAGKRIAELAAEVERLTAALHESEMAREELRKALAERDQKIEEALARLQRAGCKVRGCINPSCATVHKVQAILRGES